MKWYVKSDENINKERESDSDRSLLGLLIDSGYPVKDIDHYESDLYVYVTPLTTAIINKWCKDNGYRKELYVDKFRDNVTGKPMYDIAFQYHDPSMYI